MKPEFETCVASDINGHIGEGYVENEEAEEMLLAMGAGVTVLSALL